MQVGSESKTHVARQKVYRVHIVSRGSQWGGSVHVHIREAENVNHVHIREDENGVKKGGGGGTSHIHW